MTRCWTQKVELQPSTTGIKSKNNSVQWTWNSQNWLWKLYALKWISDLENRCSVQALPSYRGTLPCIAIKSVKQSRLQLCIWSYADEKYSSGHVLPKHVRPNNLQSYLKLFQHKEAAGGWSDTFLKENPLSTLIAKAESKNTAPLIYSTRC